MHTLARAATVLAAASLVVLSPCLAQDALPTQRDAYDRLSPEERAQPEWAAAGLDVADGLDLRLFAAEPMVESPSNMDVDHLGRVWAIEVVNYRLPRNPNNPERPEGDRIVVLEDTTGDGTADTQTVFYQGTDINSALGIAVLGDRVIVSASPNVFVFRDEDGDGRADRKEVLFTGIGGEDHDHGMHAVVFGPDGKLYFNFGNAGKQILDRSGSVIVDRSGHPVAEGDVFREGMVFRANLDGTEFEVLGHNFRNNYELAVDAFGTMWQSDNDDDGNRSVRINYVMEYGNFGYVDELTGAGWRAARTNLEERVPDRHWHQNDPGVVPNLLITGAGSPTGLLVYEGDLLPAPFRNQIIHADAGPNVVRAYPTEADGAGYTAEVADLARGTRDQRFRPSDVTTAPDGSLFIADWHDAVVGGHEKADAVGRGRVFRVAPPNVPYGVPELDLTRADAAAAALASPNPSTRYLAWMRLSALQPEAESALAERWRSGSARQRARALWMLSRHEERGHGYVLEALEDDDPDLRVTAVRAARQRPSGLAQVLQRAVQDPSPRVRREAAIALRYFDADEAPDLWAELARQHDGADRWYLEALGIGAEGPARRVAGEPRSGATNWDRFFEMWLSRVGDGWNTPAGRDIIWRARAAAAMPLLATLILDEATPPAERLRYFRAFDFHVAPSKDSILVDLLEKAHPERHQVRALALKHVSDPSVAADPAVHRILEATLASVRGTQTFVDLVARYELHERGDDLVEIVMREPTGGLALDAVRQLLRMDAQSAVETVLSRGDAEASIRLLRGIGQFEDTAAKDLLERILHDASLDVHVRREAVRGLGMGWSGERRLLEMVERGDVPDDLRTAAADVLLSASRSFIRDGAVEHLGVSGGDSGGVSGGVSDGVSGGVVENVSGNIAQIDELPPLRELAARTGDPAAGRSVFERTCRTCHVVDGDGVPFGPELSEIGTKLPKEALYLSILDPSAGINFGYEPFVVRLRDGGEIVGFVESRTDDFIELRVQSGATQRYAQSDVASISRLETSLMPAGLHRSMTEQELVDLVEYLSTLRESDTGP